MYWASRYYIVIYNFIYLFIYFTKYNVQSMLLGIIRISDNGININNIICVMGEVTQL